MKRHGQGRIISKSNSNNSHQELPAEDIFHPGGLIKLLLKQNKNLDELLEINDRFVLPPQSTDNDAAADVDAERSLLKALFFNPASKEELIKLATAEEPICINKLFLQNLAYGWIDLCSPEAALGIIAIAPLLAKDVNNLKQLIYFVKELILSDTQNQFICNEQFKLNFERLVENLKQIPEMQAIVLIFNEFYQFKRKCKLQQLITDYITAKEANATTEHIDAKGSDGILSIYDQQSESNEDMLEQFVTGLRQYMRRHYVQIEPGDLTLAKLPSDVNVANIKSTVRLFELLCIKLTDWVIASILHFRDIKKRVRAIEHWIDVAILLKNSSDYDIAHSICLGVTHFIISRLTKTLALLSIKANTNLEVLRSFFDIEMGHKNFKQKFGSKEISNICMVILIRTKAQIESKDLKKLEKMQAIGIYSRAFFYNQYAYIMEYENTSKINIEKCIIEETTKSKLNDPREEVFFKKSYQYEPDLVKLNESTQYVQITDLIAGCFHGQATIEVSKVKGTYPKLITNMKEKTYQGITAIALILDHLYKYKDKFQKEIDESAVLGSLNEILDKLRNISTYPINLINTKNSKASKLAIEIEKKIEMFKRELSIPASNCNNTNTLA